MADPVADEPGVEAPARLDDPEVRALLGALNDQLDQLEAMPGPVSELGLTVVAGVAEIYGQALIRTLELADPAAVERMLDDELIAHGRWRPRQCRAVLVERVGLRTRRRERLHRLHGRWRV